MLIIQNAYLILFIYILYIHIIFKIFCHIFILFFDYFIIEIARSKNNFFIS